MSSPSTETPAKTVESQAFKRRPPFKLCFPITREVGRACGKHPNEVVASKFYSKTYTGFQCSDKDLKWHIDRLQMVGPREKYRLPNTESQRYGWYQVRLCGPDKSDNRLNFKKNTHQLIKEHLMNYAKIRE